MTFLLHISTRQYHISNPYRSSSDTLFVPAFLSTVYYPENNNNTYGVLYFVPGLFGIVPPRLYDDLITSVAAHGYVAISVWPPANGEGALNFNFTAEAHVENINYVSESLMLENLRCELLVGLQKLFLLVII